MANTPFQTMADVRAAFPVWFSRDTMRFFNSHVESSLYAGRYFISSEQFTDGAYRAPRKYTIREVTERGIDTVGEFNTIPTIEEAREQVRQLVREGGHEQTEEE